jgi:hypothetical protein
MAHHCYPIDGGAGGSLYLLIILEEPLNDCVFIRQGMRAISCYCGVGSGQAIYPHLKLGLPAY